MNFIGDIHGKWWAYKKIIEALKGPSIQVGDFGFGFNELDRVVPPYWDMRHRFIRGNHDCPEKCQKHLNYLGDYGVTDDGIFFVGGAYSIDRTWRIEGVSWWWNEEIQYHHYDTIIHTLEQVKPDIMVTHDCPKDIARRLPGMHANGKIDMPNRTCDVLMPALLEAHRPKLWVFGHYHESFDEVIDGTRFVCLKELEVREL